MKEVEIKNIEILTDEQKKISEKIIEEYFKKIKRVLKESPKVTVQIKEYKKEGNKGRFSINANFFFAGKRIESDSMDWDLSKALHKAMIKIQNEIEYRFHISEEH